MPPSPNWDEVSLGYNAYSVLKTGKDEWGASLPTLFRAYGDYKLPVYIYFSILPIFIFGLNTFSTRFVSALSGTLAILGIYLLTNKLFDKEKLVFHKWKIDYGLAAAILLTINPWHFFISRPALEANLALTLTIFGLYYLLRGLHTKSWLAPAILLNLSMHTYNTYRIFIPILLICWWLIYRPKINFAKSNILAIFLTSIGILLIGLQIFNGQGTARYGKLKIIPPSIEYEIGEMREESSLPPFIKRLVYNKPSYFLVHSGRNYLSYFSPGFFYQTNAPQTQFAIPDRNLFTLPILMLAIFSWLAILSKPHKNYNFVLSWLLLSPIAASVTNSPPQALRPSPMIPALIIISLYGLALLNRFLKTDLIKTTTISVLLIVVSIDFVSYQKEYFTNYKNNFSQSWQYGYKQAFDYIAQHQKEYSNFFISKWQGEPHMFYAFFGNINPHLLQPGGNSIRFKQSDWFWTDKIDNIFFVNNDAIPYTDSTNYLKLENGTTIPVMNSLLVAQVGRLPINTKILKEIKFLDGSTAFIIAKFI